MMQLLMLATLVGATFSQVSRIVNDEWDSYKIAFTKQYSSVEEENERFQIFLHNLKYIREHNERYSKGEETYRVGINKHSDMNAEERASKMFGLLIEDINVDENNHMTDAEWMKLKNDLPASIDWRQKGAVTPVKDQGQCGSCWAFSATGSLEGQNFIKTGKLVSLSEQNILDCDTSDDGCNGGSPLRAFQFVHDNKGIDSEADYPYQAAVGTCNKNSSKVVADTGYTLIPSGDEKALQVAVTTKGPISVAIDANHMGFHFYAGGVYRDAQCSSTDLDHAVLVVGYGTTSNGEDYWLIKNSWSTAWGLQGYVMIARNENNMCGIASFASYPVV